MAPVGYLLERSDLLILGPVKKTISRAAPSASPPRDRQAEIYDRHAAAVYGQALLMLGDEDLAGQVARDVIVAECTLPPVSPDEADRVSRLLAATTLRRCQEVAASQARANHAAQGRHARGYRAPQGPDGTERALLGLVLFGAMGYREAARELGISPSRAAELLRAALVKRSVQPGLAQYTSFRAGR